MARRTTEDELRDYTRLQVRAGLLDEAALLDEVISTIKAEMPGTDATILARAWIARARQDLAAVVPSWPTATDHDRLQTAFAECASHGVPVLQGVADHRNARAELDRLSASGSPPRGILWFTPPDVWHAVDDGMLEVNLVLAAAANAAPGDPLLNSVLSCFARHGLSARFDQGRIEVAAHWQRRP